MTEFKRVFVDTAPIIYYLENSSLYMDSIKKFFIKCIEENIQIRGLLPLPLLSRNILCSHTVAERWNLPIISKDLLST